MTDLSVVVFSTWDNKSNNNNYNVILFIHNKGIFLMSHDSKRFRWKIPTGFFSADMFFLWVNCSILILTQSSSKTYPSPPTDYVSIRAIISAFELNFLFLVNKEIILWNWFLQYPIENWSFMKENKFSRWWIESIFIWLKFIE